MDDEEQAGGIPEQAYRARPREEWELDPRLMTPGRLVELARRRGIRVQKDERGVVVCCAECEGQIMNLDPAPYRGRKRATDMTGPQLRAARLEARTWGPAYTVDVGQLLADTVRHGVMHHDDALSGAGKEQVA